MSERAQRVGIVALRGTAVRVARIGEEGVGFVDWEPCLERWQFSTFDGRTFLHDKNLRTLKAQIRDWWEAACS